MAETIKQIRVLASGIKVPPTNAGGGNIPNVVVPIGTYNVTIKDNPNGLDIIAITIEDQELGLTDPGWKNRISPALKIDRGRITRIDLKQPAQLKIVGADENFELPAGTYAVSYSNIDGTDLVIIDHNEVKVGMTEAEWLTTNTNIVLRFTE